MHAIADAPHALHTPVHAFHSMDTRLPKAAGVILTLCSSNSRVQEVAKHGLMQAVAWQVSRVPVGGGDHHTALSGQGFQQGLQRSCAEHITHLHTTQRWTQDLVWCSSLGVERFEVGDHHAALSSERLQQRFERSCAEHIAHLHTQQKPT